MRDGFFFFFLRSFWGFSSHVVYDVTSCWDVGG